MRIDNLKTRHETLYMYSDDVGQASTGCLVSGAFVMVYVNEHTVRFSIVAQRRRSTDPDRIPVPTIAELVGTFSRNAASHFAVANVHIALELVATVLGP